MRGVGSMMAGRDPLELVKRDALDWVRNNPQAQQAIMQAQSPDEIARIVDSVITRSRSRLTEGF